MCWTTVKSNFPAGIHKVFPRSDCFSSSREFSGPVFFTRGLAWDTLNPLPVTHIHIDTYWFLSSSSPSQTLFFSCVCHTFSLSLCLCLFPPLLPLTFFLPLFSVQLVNPSSLYRTTSFDTHSKSLSVSYSTDRMRPSSPKSCEDVHESVHTALCILNTVFPCMFLHAWCHVSLGRLILLMSNNLDRFSCKAFKSWSVRLFTKLFVEYSFFCFKFPSLVLDCSKDALIDSLSCVFWLYEVDHVAYMLCSIYIKCSVLSV